MISVLKSSTIALRLGAFFVLLFSLAFSTGSFLSAESALNSSAESALNSSAESALNSSAESAPNSSAESALNSSLKSLQAEGSKEKLLSLDPATPELKACVQEHFVEFPVSVCTVEGRLEFILLDAQDDRAYESLFSAPIHGEMLHLHMVTAGIYRGNFVDFNVPLDAKTAAGNIHPVSPVNFEPKSQVYIYLQDIEGDKVWRNMNTYLKEGLSGNTLNENKLWFFSGSFDADFSDTDKKVYAANRTGCLISSFPIRDMVIGPAFSIYNPYWAEDGYPFIEAKKEAFPETGKKMMMRIYKEQKKDWEKNPPPRSSAKTTSKDKDKESATP